MKTQQLIPLLALSLLLLPSAILHAEKRVALVIGNSAYQEAQDKLPNAVADAKAVSAMLRDKLGFTVIQLDNAKPTRNLNKTDTIEALNTLGTTGKDADLVLLYYAGHGMEEIDGKENYIMPVDADIGAADAKNSALEAYGVPLSSILKKLPEDKPRIILLDCCRLRPKARGASGAEGDGMHDPDAAGIPKDTLILLAAAPSKPAADGEGANGPFALALLKHLPQPSSDIRRTFSNVRKEVISLTQNEQNPWLKLDAGGDFFFEHALVPAVTPVSVAVTLPAPSITPVQTTPPASPPSPALPAIGGVSGASSMYAGTTWDFTSSDGDNNLLYFREGGIIEFRSGGVVSRRGSWVQSGEQVIMSVGAATLRGSLKGGKLDGEGKSTLASDAPWSWQATKR